MAVEPDGSGDLCSRRLYRLFHDVDPSAKAENLRNPHSTTLRAVAEEIMRSWRSRFPGIKTVLGGSLGADIMGANSYDLDMRILLPPGMDAESDFRRVSDALASDVAFDWRRDDLANYSLIYHHSSSRTIDGIADPVFITLNIVRESEYYGLADMNLQMPQSCRDRYLVAKHKAAEAGKDEDYEAVKRHWGDMIACLKKSGYFDAIEADRPKILQRLAEVFPLFLCDFPSSDVARRLPIPRGE